MVQARMATMASSSSEPDAKIFYEPQRPYNGMTGEMTTVVRNA